MPFASWSVLTVDFLVVLHLAMGGVTLAALLHLVNAKWRFEIRYISVSFFALFPLAFVLLLILLFNGAKTFPWVGSGDAMPAWNSLGFLAAREILAFGVIGGLYGLFIKYQAVSTHSAARSANVPQHRATDPVRPRAVLHHDLLGLRDDARAGLVQLDIRDVPHRELLRDVPLGAGADRDGAGRQGAPQGAARRVHLQLHRRS